MLPRVSVPKPYEHPAVTRPPALPSAGSPVPWYEVPSSISRYFVPEDWGTGAAVFLSPDEPQSYCKPGYQQGANGSEEMVERTADIRKYCQPRALYRPYLEGDEIQFYCDSTTGSN